MTEDKKNIDLKSFFEILKRYAAVVIGVIVAATAAGIATAFIKKPVYTATELVNYYAIIEGDTTATKNNTAMTAYLATVVDFCDTGIVVNRANYYYGKFIEARTNGTTLEEFMSGVREKDDYAEKLAAGEAFFQTQYVIAENVSSVHEDADTVSIYSFNVSYKDENAAAAKEKLRILLLAYDLELRDYFLQLKTYVTETAESVDDIHVAASFSKKTIVLVFVIAGIVLGVAAAYVCYISDGRIRSKEELEKITGTKLLGYIRKTGEEK